MKIIRGGENLVKAKDVIANTILYISIVLFVVIFKTIFGAENTLIGVTTVTAMLMFLQRDLTLEPIKNTLALAGINIISGLGAFIALNNIFLGVIINFSIMFIISYMFSYTLKKPLYLPLSLQYLFMLTTPVTNEALVTRLLALVFGAISIMTLQLILNRNKVSKSGDKIIVNICDNIIKKINTIHKVEAIDNHDAIVSGNVVEFKKIADDRRKKSFYFTEEVRLKMNIVISLKNINRLLNNLDSTKVDHDIFRDLIKFLNLTRDLIYNKEFIQGNENVFDGILLNYKNNNCYDRDILRILKFMAYIEDSFEELKNLGEENYNDIKREIRTKNNKLLANLNFKSLKFSYSFRIAIGVSLGGFIVDYFNFSEGRWMLFTILSITVPIYELGQRKLKDRIFATFIGAILAVILFGIFHSTNARTLLIMSIGYINSYLTEYRYTTIGVTISAIGSAALAGGTGKILTINRIEFVLLGALIALIINKFIFPYRIKDEIKNLKDMYEETIYKMLLEIYFIANKKHDKHCMLNLMIISYMIDDKLMETQKLSGEDNEMSYIDKQRAIVGQIYEVYLWLDKHSINESNLKFILRVMDVVKGDKDILEKNYLNMNLAFKTVNNIEDEILVLMLEDILKNVNQM